MWSKTKWKFLLCSSILACIINFMPVAADEHGSSCDCYECLSKDWSTEQQEYLSTLCINNDLDISVLKAVAWNESRLQPKVTHVNNNGTTDWGMFQINDVCLSFLKEKIGLDSMNELLDPYTNIDAAVTLMRYHKDATGDDALALMRYQCGEGTFKKKLQQGIYSTKTQQRVLEVAKEVVEVDKKIEAEEADQAPILYQQPLYLTAALPKIWDNEEDSSQNEEDEEKNKNIIFRKKQTIVDETFGEISFGGKWYPDSNSGYVTIGYTGK